jgi:hypothetical protein
VQGSGVLVRVEFEGETWELDTTHISYKHAMGIQSHTGMPIADWLDATNLESDDEGKTIKNPGPQWLPAVGALYWLMRQQNGKPVAFADMDFDYTAFYAAYLKAIYAEIERLQAERDAKAAAKAAEADPTRPPSPTASPESPMSATPTTTTPQSLVPAEAAIAF